MFLQGMQSACTQSTHDHVLLHQGPATEILELEPLRVAKLSEEGHRLYLHVHYTSIKVRILMVDHLGSWGANLMFVVGR